MTVTSVRYQNVWGPVSTICWGILIILLSAIAQAAVVYFIASRAGIVSLKTLPAVIKFAKYSGFVLAWCTLAGAAVGVLTIVGVVRLKRDSSLSAYLGLKIPSGQQAIQWLAIFLTLVVFATASSPREPIVPDFMLRTYASLQSPWILWLAFLVAAPVFEELFFRGFLLSGLSLSALKWTGSVIVCSIGWAMMHVQYDIRGILHIFVLGLFLGAARVKTGSTILAIFLHSVSNLIATVQTVIRVHHFFA